MNLTDLKRKAAEAAAKLAANEGVRSALDAAVAAGQTVAREARNLGDEVRKQIDASRPMEDDTAVLKERLDRLREEARLREEDEGDEDRS